jgi:hypothetical protein
MQSFASRAGRWPLALTLALAALGACADEPPTTAPGAQPKPNLAIGDVITVTNTSGGTDWGSLRWAVGQTLGGETIRFDPSLAGATITLDTTLKLSHYIAIEGSRDRGIIISGGGKVRVMYVDTEGVTLKNLTITGGFLTGDVGFAIYSLGEVVLENSTVRNNAGAYAAIHTRKATLINSTVAGNTSTSTLAGISYKADGGLVLVSSTVAFNNGNGVAPFSGVPSAPGTLRLYNSIIANNGTPGSPTANCYYPTSATTTYVGTNISNDASCGEAPKMLVQDPMLGTLADHGGPSQTIDIARESPAVNAALEFCLVGVDQRYVPRDAKCDVGAFEVTEFTRVTLTVDPGAAVNQKTGWAVVTGTVQCSRSEVFTLGLAVGLTQEQKSGKSSSVVQAAGSTPFACSPSVQPWSVALAPSAGAFGNGSAEATVQTANTPEWVTPSLVTKPVKLYWARK